MLSMSAAIDIDAQVMGQTNAGLLRGVKSMMAGESFFTTIFTARSDAQELSLAPSSFGEIVSVHLGGKNYYISSGGYLANCDSVSIDLVYEGFKGWLAKKGVFLLSVAGDGHVFLASSGSVRRRTLKEGEQLIIDNSYVIAFEKSLTYELVTASRDLKSTLMSGEGLINRYTGPGEVIYQTRAAPKTSGILTSVINVVT
jgi:uncharacterized protein (TIGR00266 family)